MEVQRAQSRTRRGLALDDKKQPTSICLYEGPARKHKYNIGREYKFYVTIQSGQRSKVGTAITIRKELPHKRLTLKTTI